MELGQRELLSELFTDPKVPMSLINTSKKELTLPKNKAISMFYSATGEEGAHGLSVNVGNRWVGSDRPLTR